MTRIINKMYGGNVELVFNPLKHQYTVDDEVVVSVTTALGVLSKPALIYWSANMAAEYVKENIKPGVAMDEMDIERLYEGARRAHTKKKTDAGSLGSFVHNWVEDYINGKNPPQPINEQMLGATERFLDWQKKHDVEFLLAEQPIYSRRHNYAGITDFICKIDGKMWIGDLKTSNGIYDTYYSQASAYLQARVEEFPDETYEGIVVVRVGKKDGDFEVGMKTYAELLPYQKLFNSCLDTYKCLKEVENLK